jgi:transposase InsO family protein
MLKNKHLGMPYTLNPQLPKIRAQAVEMVRSGKSLRQTARYFGFNPATICKWVKRAPGGRVTVIPTRSSRPKSHPRKLNSQIVRKIIDLRIATKGRCAEVIHRHLLNEGIAVGLNSVKRTLKRNGMIKKRSPWKKYHLSGERPRAIKPGDLVQLDTIHIMKNEKKRIYIYTLLDVYSRWAYAWASKKMSAGNTLQFVKKATGKSEFDFDCLQSDHGPEFSPFFTSRVKARHRHSRVRKPNDNAHLERFNRTLQDEFLRYLPIDVKIINRHLPKYLKYYNEQRLHLGLGLKTPSQLLTNCCQAID